MVKKGFTLVEILAVVTIIGLILIISLPKISNSLNSKKQEIDTTTSNMIISAAKLYVKDNSSKFDKVENNVYCLPIVTLTEKGYLESPVKNVTNDKDITNSASVRISYDNNFKYEVVKKEECKIKVKKTNYKVGNLVTYNEMNFYVIKDSDESKDYVTLLKVEPLSVDEVNTYGAGHVNNYTQDSVGTAFNQRGYGGVAYYSSPECGYIDGVLVNTNCLSDYNTSDMKYIIDNWTKDKFDSNDLAIDDTGYSSRLLQKKEYEAFSEEHTWKYSPNYDYTIINTYSESSSLIYFVRHDNVIDGNVFYVMTLKKYLTVRPVVNIYKTALD